MNKADRLRVKAVEATQKECREQEAAKRKEGRRVQNFRNERARDFAKHVLNTLDERTGAAAADGKTSIEYGNWSNDHHTPFWDFTKFAAVKALVKKLQKQGFIVTAGQHRSKPSTDPDMWGRVDETVKLVIEWN